MSGRSDGNLAMRLFAALELDERARDRLADYQRRLRALDAAVRWVRPEQIHLTLKFLGEVPDERVPPILKALDTLAIHPAFRFEMGGVGTFGSSRSPRVVWAGVKMPNPSLSALQQACEEQLAPLGYPPEGRRYSPHLTLGRVKDFRAGRQIAEAVDRLEAQVDEPLEQAAEHVVLFESLLSPKGSQYIAVHKVLLRKG